MLLITPDKPTDHDGLIDNSLKAIIAQLKKEMDQNNDDAFIFFVGDTGTGKSTLLQNIIAEYSGETSYSQSNTVFNLSQYAKVLARLSQEAHNKIIQGQSPRGGYIAGDEFDLQAIEAQTKKNRSLDKIFNTVRLHQIFQGLCWPQLEKLPKSFIKDRVKFVIVLNSKEAKDRTYILYTKNDIRRLFNDGEDSLTVGMLSSTKIVNKYASLGGWFKENPNIKDPEYVKNKSQAIVDRINDFAEQLNEEEQEPNVKEKQKEIADSKAAMNLRDVANYTGLSKEIVLEKINSCIRRGIIMPAEVKTTDSKYKLTIPTIDKILAA